MNKLPVIFIFLLFIFFAAGIVIGSFFDYPVLFLAASILTAGLAFIFFKQRKIIAFDAAIVVLLLCLGALWQGVFNYHKPVIFSGERVLLVLRPVSLPREYKNNNSFTAEVKAIDGLPARFQARVFDFSRRMEYLNSYLVQGKLVKKHYKGNEFFYFWVKTADTAVELKQGRAERLAKKASLAVINIFKENLNDEGYRFASSALLGRRELLYKEEKNIFTDAGIAHLLAISGSNVALAAGILFFILQLFGAGYRLRLVVSVIFLYIYNLIVGLNPPILRATIMYSVFALGFFLKRKVNPYNCLGLAGIIILAVNPLWIFDAGAQLSFISVLALIAGFRMFPVKSTGIAFFDDIKYIFFSSLYVTMAIAPFTVYYFKRIYLLAVFYNIILIPFFTVILVIAFFIIFFSKVTFISLPLGAVLSLFVNLFYRLAAFLGGIKFSFIETGFNLQMWAYCVTLPVFLAAVKYNGGMLEKLREVKKTLNGLFLKLAGAGDNPAKIAAGLALGVFLGVFPGTGPIAAVAMAVILRVNKLAALSASLLVNTWINFITFPIAAYFGSLFLRVERYEIYTLWEAISKNWQWGYFLKILFSRIFLAIMVGYCFIGLFLAAVVYFVSLFVITRAGLRRQAEKK